jgi:hypothetical protein
MGASPFDAVFFSNVPLVEWPEIQGDLRKIYVVQRALRPLKRLEKVQKGHSFSSIEVVLKIST